MFFTAFSFIDRWLLRTLKLLCGITFCIVVFSVIMGIVFRYVFRSPLPWVEELSRLSFVWATFLGACVATREKRHLKIVIFSGRLGRTGEAIHDIVVSCFALFFLIVVLWQGRLVYEAMSMQMYAGMPISQKWQALPIVLGSAMMAAYFMSILIAGIIALLRKGRLA
ncbi:MAG: TRAP transporter small permease [Deltaproteobacteria bacterium]|nr:TRAP transporter small permease [Deltaproteobacteria bacterium]